MFRSLRTRLIASFGLVIVLSLIGAGTVSVWLIRHEQAQSAEERIGRLVDPLSQQVLQMQLLGWPTERIAQELAGYARYFDVRILLVDREDRVVLDTDLRRPMVGEQLEQPVREAVSAGPGEAYRSARRSVSGQDLYLFTSAAPQGRAPAGWPFQIQEVGLVVAVPATDVTSAWAQLLPRLLAAGAIAAAFAVVVAVLIARRITRPIAQMTHASQAMARGDYRQRVDVRGGDEVATLGQAFNEMSHQVDRSTRAMRQLLANVSHELKTPLTSIQGYSQAMLDGVLEDEEERLRAADIVHQEAERMRALVDDLLYLSQLESGQSPLTIEAVDVDASVASTERRFRLQAEAAGVELQSILGAGSALADERRLEQILANLVDNAIRFAPGGSAVSLGTTRERGVVSVDVHNYGPPIPEQDLAYVFDRFYQVDRARTSDGHRGLGLAIVRELVQAHGGDITVTSTAEAGTTFRVQLPAAPGPAERRSPEAAERDARPAHGPRLAT